MSTHATHVSSLYTHTFAYHLPRITWLVWHKFQCKVWWAILHNTTIFITTDDNYIDCEIWLQLQLHVYDDSCVQQDGQIDAEELQRCLTQSGISGSYQPFGKETCRIMIAMLDRDYSGKMGFNEFKELWTALNQWKVYKCIHVEKWCVYHQKHAQRVAFGQLICSWCYVAEARCML